MRASMKPTLSSPRCDFVCFFAPARLWHLISGGARNEQPQRSSAKVQLPSQRGAQSTQGRNGINGRGPFGGKDAVYAGSDLEPIAPMDFRKVSQRRFIRFQ